VDVLLERRREMHETTLNEAIKQFGESYCTTIKSGPKVRAALKRHVSPKLGKLRLKDVRRADVIQLVERMAEAHPRQAAHVLAYTKRMFAWAADRELIEADPVSSLKPKRISALLTPVNRARVLTDEEIKSFWESAETSGMHKLTAMALKFVLVTGQRPGEVSAMRWDEVDEDAKLWTIPASRRGKTGTAHTVPLTDTALEILADTMREVARLERRRGKGPRLIVFEARPDMALTASALSLAASRFKSELGNQDLPDLGHWRPHDLRRTMRTGLAACRIDEVVAELTVGHTRKGIAATYDRYSYMPERRAAMEAWERRLLRIVAGQPADGNVVTLAQTRRSQKRA
jgi:integrase